MNKKKIKQFIVSFNPLKKTTKKVSFFDVAKKNIMKNKNSTHRNLSKEIDKILYGA